MRIRFALPAMLAVACWSASGDQQRIEIHVPTGDVGWSKNPNNPSNQKIREGLSSDENACAGPLVAGECTKIGAADVREAYELFGEPVGKEIDGAATIRVIVHGADGDAAYSGHYDAIYLPERDGWKNGTGVSRSDVHHEMAMH